jgi:hypothetical protein
MNMALMTKTLGPIGELAMKQAAQQIQMGQAAETKRHNKAEEERQSTDVVLQQQKEAREAADKTNAQKLAAADTLSHQGPIQRITNMLPFTRSPENQVLRDVAAGNSQMLPGPHGATVTQNGHTYTWNGKAYE